jgi:alkanesulfonate monooxygenase SsuD/methylene tetrahydromethanopterin reductase-like flavin-dependent oxidoreductase (luciferase family)
MMRLAARYADAWNTNGYGLPSELFSARRDVFRRACEAERRDPSSIEVTVGVEIAMSASSRARTVALPPDADAVASALDAWAAEGVGHVQLNALPASESAIDLVNEALRRHRGL